MDGNLKILCETFLSGSVNSEDFLQRCLQLTSARAAAAEVDVHRARRCGFPEVVYAAGKPLASLLEIVATLHRHGQPVLATRVSESQANVLVAAYPDAIWNSLAGTFRLAAEDSKSVPPVGKVAVVTAGTSDLPVSLEAQETLRWMNVEVLAVDDVGVAGPHRLPAYVETLREADAVVVVAGMEGALPSIVGGYLSRPVIGVPTSVGYGASFQGVAALLGMLNSCAANVTVVNIDAGFKGGYVAGLIAHRSHARS